MGEEYRGKVFRSGNSVALRLPKALGFTEGTEVRLVERGAGNLLIETIAAEQKIDVDRIWGIWKGSNIVLSADRSFDERPSARDETPDRS